MINSILTSKLFFKLLLIIRAIILTSNPLAKYPLHQSIQEVNWGKFVANVNKIADINDIRQVNKELKLPVDLLIENNNHSMMEYLINNNILKKNIPNYFNTTRTVRALENIANSNDYTLIKLLISNDITYDKKSMAQLFSNDLTIKNIQDQIESYENKVIRNQKDALTTLILPSNSNNLNTTIRNNTQIITTNNTLTRYQLLNLALVRKDHTQILHAIKNEALTARAVLELLSLRQNLPMDLVPTLLDMVNPKVANQLCVRAHKLNNQPFCKRVEEYKLLKQKLNKNTKGLSSDEINYLCTYL